MFNPKDVLWKKRKMSLNKKVKCYTVKKKKRKHFLFLVLGNIFAVGKLTLGIFIAEIFAV